MEYQKLSKKILNICIVFIIIVIIFFIAGVFMLHYNVNGENNIPFRLSKISIISTVDGEDQKDSNEKWNINITQDNDIYLYIEKNDKYSKTETISQVEINNFKIVQAPSIGEIKIYKPTVNENSIFKKLEDNIANDIVFCGSTLTDIQNLKISNQGGVICFRCANNGLGNFISADEEEINYNNLLSKINIKEEEIKSRVSFDIIISLNSGKSYEAENIEIQIPNDGIVEKGTIGKEMTDLENIVFKRVTAVTIQ